MRNRLLGAIIGDICGSVYEFDKTLIQYAKNTPPKDIKLVYPDSTFTDDTICTIAIADALIKSGRNTTQEEFAKALKHWVRRYNYKGCGGMFRQWAASDSLEGYGSYGNGAAMRISPIGFYENDILADAVRAATDCTHNCDEANKGALAIADAINLAVDCLDKQEIQDYMAVYYPELEELCLDDIRPTYKFEVSCGKSVPQAILCFLESESYEHCIQLAISLGGDSDTIAAMAGGIAYAYYGEIPQYLVDLAYEVLPDEMLEVIENFDKLCEELYNY